MANTGHAAAVRGKIAEAQKNGPQSFVMDITSFVEKANGNIDKAMRQISIDLASRIILRTPVDTGRARANWMPSPGSIDSSAPSVPPAPILAEKDAATRRKMAEAWANRESMNRLARTRWDPRRDRSFFFTNTLPYIIPLEYGWSQVQAPDGMVRVSLAEFHNVVKQVVINVRSGG